MTLRRGLTLLEVLISAAVLAVLVVIIASATLVLNTATVEANIGLDMENTARRILAEIRRDVRASGWKQDGNQQFRIHNDGVPAVTDTPNSLDTPNTGNTIEFRKRLGPRNTNDDPQGWSSLVIYRIVTAAEPYQGLSSPPTRYDLEMVRDGNVIQLAADVSDLDFEHIDGTIQVTLELTRNNPRWTGGTPPPPITRVFVDQIQVLNQEPD